MVKDLFKRANDLGIKIEIDPSAKAFLVEKGYDPQFGARPLRRALQKYVEDPMAEAILANNLTTGDTIKLVYDEEKKPGELEFVVQKGEAALVPENDVTKVDEAPATDGKKAEKSPTEAAEESTKD